MTYQVSRGTFLKRSIGIKNLLPRAGKGLFFRFVIAKFPVKYASSLKRFRFDGLSLRQSCQDALCGGTMLLSLKLKYNFFRILAISHS